MRLLLLTFVSFLTCFDLRAQQEASSKVDNLIIHEPDVPRQTIAEALEIYDNKELKGSPMFVVDNKFFVDLRSGKKEYDYKEYYKKLSTLKDSDSPFAIIKQFPVDFVGIYNLIGYVIPIESKNGDVLKIQNKELYFKITSKNLKIDLDTSMVWRSDGTLEGARKYLKENKEFAKFMNDFSSCVDLKNAECLFKLSPEFKGAIESWTLLNDEKSCQKRRLGEDIYLKNIKSNYVVDWELYKRFLALSDSKIESIYTISDFGNKESLSIELVGDTACSLDLKIRVESIKKKSEKTIIRISPYPGAA